jgi:hypothetical protein
VDRVPGEQEKKKWNEPHGEEGHLGCGIYPRYQVIRLNKIHAMLCYTQPIDPCITDYNPGGCEYS